MFKFVVLAALVATAAAATFKPRLDGRIVGGEDTTIEDWPHQVDLQYYDTHICGGSIIADKWVVTAAHCTDGSYPNEFDVHAGVTKLSDGGQKIRVKNIYQHRNYSKSTIDCDISVLELEKAIEFGASAQPIALPEEGTDPAADQEVVCTGWGTTEEGGWYLSDILQAVTVNIVGRDVCMDQYGSTEYAITENMICAGVEKGGKSTCQGDSGGPLVADGQLVGIVSWGLGCAREGFPGVYSNVGALRSFIKASAGI